MTTILDNQLYSHSDRLAGKVVLITGAGASIGKETALQCAKFRSHASELSSFWVASTNLERKPWSRRLNAREAEWASTGCMTCSNRRHSESIGLHCNATSWEDQFNLFQTAFDTFGSVDVAVANAGVGEIGDFSTSQIKKGKLEKVTNILPAHALAAHLAIRFLESVGV